MKLNTLISTALALSSAVPGALSVNANLRGSDTAAVALDMINHQEGPLRSNLIGKYASGGPRAWLSRQGERDVNCNPCYCNPKAKEKSKKQCRDGYTCVNHKCQNNDDGSVEEHCVAGSNGRSCCFKDGDCRSGNACQNRICEWIGNPVGDEGSKCKEDEDCAENLECKKRKCRRVEKKIEERGGRIDIPEVSEGGTCSIIDGLLCRKGLSCIDGVCRATARYDIPENNACNTRNGDRCAPYLSCNNGFCRSTARYDIPENDPCNLQNGDRCAPGLICNNRFCRRAARYNIQENDNCNTLNGDRCAPGLSCDNGFCRSTARYNIQENDVCNTQKGDRCAPGLICRNGFCRSMRRYNEPASGGDIPLRGDCTNDRHGCEAGLTCRRSEVNGSDRWFCRRPGSAV